MRVPIFSLFLLLLPLAPLPAQAAKVDLEKARLIEEAERNPAKAVPLYRAVAEDEKAPSPLREEAWFRLGLCLERLGKKKEAQAAWKKAAAGKSPWAKKAQARWKGAPPKGELLGREVQKLVKEYLNNGDDHLWGRLVWIGQPAVPFLVQAISRKPRDLDKVERVVQVILRIGGKGAAHFLSQASKDPDPLYRRVVARHLDALPDSPSPELQAAALAFLDDPDTMVRLEVLKKIKDMEERITKVFPGIILSRKLLALTEDPHPKMRKYAMDALLLDYEYGVDAGKDPNAWKAVFRQYLARAFRAFREKDEALKESVYRLFFGTALFSSSLEFEEGNRLFLEAICSSRTIFIGDFHLGWIPGPEEVLAAAKKLGPWKDQAGRRGLKNHNKKIFSKYVTSCLSGWKKEAWPAVLELARMGYAREGTDAFVSWIAKNVPAGKLPEFFVTTLEIPLLEGIPHLPPECLPFLEKLAALIAGKRDRRFDYWKKMVPFALAGIRKREASDFLAGLVEKHPEVYSLAAEALMKRDMPEGIPAMIRLLQLPGPPGDGKTAARKRNELFLFLVKKGTPGAEEAYSRAYVRGLEKNKIIFVVKQGSHLSYSFELRGIQFLFLSPNSLYRVFTSPYPPKEKARILEACLSRGGLEAWKDLGEIFRQADFPGANIFSKSKSTLFFLPRPAMEVVARKLPQAPDPGIARDILRAVLDRAAWRPSPPSFLHALALGVVQSGRKDLIRVLLGNIENKDKSGFPELVSLLLPFLEDPDLWQIYTILDFLSAYPEDKVFQAAKRLLARKDPALRSRAVTFLAKTFKGRAGKAILPLLRDPDPLVRRAAANSLLSLGGPYLKDLAALLKDSDPDLVRVGIEACRRRLSKEDIPALLEVLRKGTSANRNLAKAVLKEIRFYYEQKAFWSKWLSGAGLGSNPAEALANQASPGKSKKIRLAAIESLGTLGDPKALPFLIHLMEEKDPDIAAAASKAVQKINRSPRKTPPGPKK